MTYQNWNKCKDKACLSLSFLELNKWYHMTYAWELSEVEPIEDVLYYEHPRGAVIWVKDVKIMDEMQDERIRYRY